MPKSLRFVSVDRELRPDLVTQEEVWDEYPDDYPEESLRGEEYLVLPEEKGAVTFTATLEASGFKKTDRVQLDIGTQGGYRSFEVVDPPEGDEPQTFEWTVGPAPVGRIGTVTFIAFEIVKKGAVGEQLARYDA